MSITSIDTYIRLRQILQCLVVKRSFHHLSLFFIGLNRITLTMECPSLSVTSFIVDLTTMYWSTVIPLNTESEEATCIFVMLRVINRASGLKLVLQALMSSLRPIDHIVIICKFYYCEGPLAHNVTIRQQSEEMLDHHWKNQQHNFDHLGQALLCIFVLS
ncbi:unnamed protein product [Rotaria sp. Silwood1]|nr:unnamed protein product [Rotaria sp. Silwood1]